MKNSFTVVMRGCDEQDFEFHVNGERVGHVTYDDVGWEGLSRSKAMFEKIAEVIGATFTVEEGM